MMKPLARIGAVIAALTLAAPATAQDALEAMADYMAFATYEAGIILPQQIDDTVFAAATFIDTRDAAQFDAGAIPGALNIEWRETLDRIDEIPASGVVILYCNTGSLSAQATFALRVAGRENVLVLQSGLLGWQENAAYHP